MKRNGIEVQKGELDANIPVQKNMGYAEKALEDYENRIGRKEGQMLNTHIPKTNVRKSLKSY